MERYYRICNQNVGKVARITDRRGRFHVGRIVRVTPQKVFISPMIRRGAPGYGYGWWGGWGWGWGAAYGIGLGLITGIALGGLFFW